MKTITITKKVFLISVLIFTISSIARGQFSNASLNGPWMTYTDTHTYILFDGIGNINEIGAFGGVTGSNIGTYSVSGSGAITGNFSIWSLSFTGQLLTADTGSLNIPSMGILPLYKISSPGELTDTLTGMLTDDSTSTSKNVIFKLNSSGQITYASGLSGVNGRIYTENGIFAGYISSTDNSMGTCWLNMTIGGTYTGNTLSGGLNLDCSSNGGTVNLLRTGNATISGISAYSVNNNFSIFPNPATSKLIVQANPTNPFNHLNIELCNYIGETILSREITTLKNNEQIVFDIEKYPAGIYFVKINSENTLTTYKIIKTN